ncbi:DUF5343 domain-containing protein [Lacipirellula sp.]|uniref:DUF5343 domain-containing protein n=1 Tax=Lacipirellula sp. TaxID=2691419 RepID=UPI003D095FBE
MSDNPPFMNAYGLIPQIFDRIKSAKTPPRFTQDFLASKLGFSSGSGRAFIPFAKRLGFIGSDGVPTELYSRFRNTATSRLAMAEAVRKGFADLFSRNEYVYELPEPALRGLIVEATGLEEDSPTLRAIAKSFMELRELADFDNESDVIADADSSNSVANGPPTSLPLQVHHNQPSTIGVGLSYTINLNLPETTDIAVFNAIFKSLRENLLQRP